MSTTNLENAAQPQPESVKKPIPSTSVGAGEVIAEAAVGAAAGAAMGVLAGPIGAAAGAVIGGVVAAVAGATLHEERVYEDQEDEKLDREIGVIGGDLGVAKPNAPKSRRGAFHAASLGVSGQSAPTPSEGPMQNLSEE